MLPTKIETINTTREFLRHRCKESKEEAKASLIQMGWEEEDVEESFRQEREGCCQEIPNVVAGAWYLLAIGDANLEDEEEQK